MCCVVLCVCGGAAGVCLRCALVRLGLHLTLYLTTLCHPPCPPPRPLLHRTCRELWALADFLTALSSTEDVREGLAMWAAGTYRGPQSLRRRDPAARPVDSDGEE
jgi:hypothetical protein